MASTIPSGLYVTQAFGARPCRPRETKLPRPLPIAAPMRSPASSKEANSRPHPAGRPRTGAGGRCQSLDTGRRRCAGRVEQRGVSLSLQDQTRFVRDTDRRDDPGVRRGTSQSRAQVCRRSGPLAVEPGGSDARRRDAEDGRSAARGSCGRSTLLDPLREWYRVQYERVRRSPRGTETAALIMLALDGALFADLLGLPILAPAERRHFFRALQDLASGHLELVPAKGRT